MVILACGALAAAQEPLQVRVQARRWAWEFDYGGGVKTAGVLRLARGQEAQLSLTTQDVMHRFHVPALGAKVDVEPGRTATLRLTPGQAGTFQAVCARYCGSGHQGMTAQVMVVERAELDRWLLEMKGQGPPPSAERGRELFGQYGCHVCHAVGRSGGPQGGPRLFRSFGQKRKLQDGSHVRVDEGYIRESLISPGARITAGFQPIMPAFGALLSGHQITSLILYIKSLR